MFGNIPKLNDDAHEAFLKAERVKRAKEKDALVHGATRSTAGGPHARVCRTK